MSKATDFLSHLGEAPQSREQLAEASGEDQKTVSNRLTALKAMGLAQRTADGWVRIVKSNGGAEQVNGSVAPPPKAARKKRVAKRHTSRRRAAEAAAAEIEEATLSFFIDEDFELQICRKDGTGEAAIIPREEALRLRDFLNQVGDLMRLA